jgi:hypothetical protein
MTGTTRVRRVSDCRRRLGAAVPNRELAFFSQRPFGETFRAPDPRQYKWQNGRWAMAKTTEAAH